MPDLPVNWFKVTIVWKRRRRSQYAPEHITVETVENADETSDPEILMNAPNRTPIELREDERNRLYTDWKAYCAALANPDAEPTATRGDYLVVNRGIRERKEINFEEVADLEFAPEPMPGFVGPSHYDDESGVIDTGPNGLGILP